VTSVEDTGDGRFHTKHHCDCTSAFDIDGNLYAGKYCEHKATVYCADDDMNLFCTQGGQCNPNPIQGCDCQEGTAGYKCEFIVDNLDQGSIAVEEVDNEDEDGGVTIEVDNDAEDEDNGVMIEVDNDDEVGGVVVEVDNENENQLSSRQCGDGECLNGGFCITTSVILDDGTQGEIKECDCSQAYYDEAAFSGPFCQYKVTNVCGDVVQDSFEGITSFCVHHGTCQEDGSCDCPSGWAGDHCEIQVLASNDPNNELDGDTLCGESVCHNGGVCIENETDGSDGSVLEVTLSCDCSSAYDNNYLYAGEYCQFPSTKICTETPQGQDLQGSVFCTNHGTCNGDQGCICPPGFYGFSCEFEDYQRDQGLDNDPTGDVDTESCGDEGLVCRGNEICVELETRNKETGATEIHYSCDEGNDDNNTAVSCTLQCMNGGFCAHGVKDLGALQDTVADVSHLNQTYDKETFQHCICPEGFVGLTCDHKIEICGKDEHVCFHGSQCVLSENGSHSCDCSQADEKFDGVIPAFAGDSCQYTPTEICSDDEERYPGEPLSFCVNNGKCLAKVNGNEPHPGCSCPDGYSGPHCEQHILQSESRSSVAPKPNTAGMVAGIAVGALAAACVVFLIAVRTFRKKNPSTTGPDGPNGTPFPRRRRRRPGNGSVNIAQSTAASSSSDGISTMGLALTPDDEPESEDADGIILDGPEQDEDPVFVDVVREDDASNKLDNVDFV
jgi:Notch-like protein